MNKKTRRGFTIVELVIVIAVIAILAAVLIPTFASVIKKANLSADQQAVTTMNKQLAIADVDEDIDSLPEAITALAKAGLDLEDYKPLTKDHYFYFTVVDGTPTVIFADKEDKIVFPAGLTKEDTTSWYSLSGITPVEKVDIVSNNATVNSGAQLAYVIDSAKAGKETVSNVTLNADVDLRGAGVDFGKVTSDLTIDGNNKTLAGVRADDNVYSPTTGEFAGVQYGYGFIGEVPAGKTVTIKDVTLDGLFSGSANVTGDVRTLGLIAGYVKGTLVLENVTIKNATVSGYQKVGAIAGQILGGTVILKNVTFVSVTVDGTYEVATIAGIVDKNSTITLENTTTDGITITTSTTNLVKKTDITFDNSAEKLVGSDNNTFAIIVSGGVNYYIGVTTTDIAWAYTHFGAMADRPVATVNGSTVKLNAYTDSLVA